MQNLLSDFGIFIDTAYGLIFVHGLLPLVLLSLSHFDFCFIPTE